MVKALTSGRYQSEGTQGEAITDGIDITNWQVKNDEEDGELTFSVWDFAGQTVYYNTHQVLNISMGLLQMYVLSVELVPKL